MAEKGADYHLITKMEEIAWLFNLRGNDVANTPVFFSFALIEQERASLYVLDDSADLAIDGIEFFPYLQIFEDLRKLQKGRILLDEEIASYAITAAIPDSVEIIIDSDPGELMKALKNPVEIAATKKRSYQRRRGHGQFPLLAEKNHRQSPDVRNFRRRLPGKLQTFAERLVRLELRYHFRLCRKRCHHPLRSYSRNR